MKRLVLFLKGICMGIADVIPGVSGGTLALILGVYTELVDTIKGLNLRFLAPLLAWLRGGRQPEDLEALKAAVGTLNLPFLITLGLGIVTALGIGSAVIPSLMENHPVVMRALFFGLIVASVYVPFRMIDFDGHISRFVAFVAVLAGLGFGYVVTSPANSFDASRSWSEVESRGETVKELTRRGPSAMPSEAVFWAENNAALREAVAASDPEAFARLEVAREQVLRAEAGEGVDKDAIKARSAPYDEIVVPEGTPVQLPRPTLWFVFAAGMVAICAMILPGISGSYILLILNVYFFVLNALKGFLSSLAHLELPTTQAPYVLLFCAGCAIGILSFARLLSYLLHRHPVPTLGVLVGLMVGCLRGIWPFRSSVDGVAQNVLPAAIDGEVVAAMVAALAGAALVILFTYLGHVREEGEAMES